VEPHPLWIERAADALPSPLQHVRVDHGSADVFVAKQFLHGANVVAVRQQMRGEAMPQGMAASPFLNHTLPEDRPRGGASL
jgi:hypothetical protein